MNFIPLNRMLGRTSIARENSDSEYFYSLILAGEFLTKIVTLGLIAAVSDDPEHHKYRHLYGLTRADGVGDWGATLNDVLVGPTSQYIVLEARTEYEELTKKTTSGSWQYEALELLFDCVGTVHKDIDKLPLRAELRQWFTLFAVLRNKTKGHGAESSATHSKLVGSLSKSIELLYQNFNLFKRSWAFLHQNLSGKYRVSKISSDTTPFDPMKSTPSPSMPDGIYIYYGRPAIVALFESEPELTDFWIANGNFRKDSYELLSYISGDIKRGSGIDYLIPAGSLPPSETQGADTIELVGQTFSNLPPVPSDYIHRDKLEAELKRVILVQDRYPIITLVGRGGIGKTYLASRVLHDLADSGQFSAIFWFSARDLDLLSQGPKPVRPQVLTSRDIAKEFARLVEPDGWKEKSFDPTSYFQKSLFESQPPLHDMRIVFVFDNFETVDNPVEIFTWIDTYIRTPNKALITTRHREFKGDYPVEVTGMVQEEFDKLVDQTADRLGIGEMLTPRYSEELFRESDGHPYVAKILLGEVAKAQRLVGVNRIFADREHILDALFERTYANLSPVAKRVFLTLCNWRSVVPQLALEAVLLRPTNERMDVQRAIEELVQSSFIELAVSDSEDTIFLSVPLVAKLFGIPKLRVNPLRASIEADTQLLQLFGATSPTEIRRGMVPRIQSLIRHVNEHISGPNADLEEYIPILEFIARKHPATWVEIASIYETSLPKDQWLRSEQALRKYLEYNPSDINVWNRLLGIYRNIGDEQAEINALVSMCMEPDIPYEILSNTANALNRIFANMDLPLETEEKQIVVQQLASLMESRIDEADADDYSRLAWLCLHLRDREKAHEMANKGLSLEPNNQHCANVLRRL